MAVSVATRLSELSASLSLAARLAVTGAARWIVRRPNTVRCPAPSSATNCNCTGARAVKNWFEAKNGPSGEFLIVLCRHSDSVLETLLRMAGREEQLKSKKLIDAKTKLRQMLSLIDELQGRASVPPWV
jgi:hypothetical protein